MSCSALASGGLSPVGAAHPLAHSIRAGAQGHRGTGARSEDGPEG